MTIRRGPIPRLRRAALVAVSLLLVLPAGGLLGGSRAAEAADLVDIQRTFLRDRDAGRLLRALESSGQPLPPGLLDLTRWAAGTSESFEDRDAKGRVADVARAVFAFRARDLTAAREALAQVSDAGTRAGTAEAWLTALLLLRRGDDSGAVGRVLAPPLFRWSHDAFVLALLGAALPEDDLYMLSAGAFVALERSAARGRRVAIEAMTLALAALHRRPGRDAFPFAVRTLRRGGHIDDARRVLALAAPAGVQQDDPRLAMEAALTAWSVGAWKQVPELLKDASPPAGARAEYLALRHAGPRGRVIEAPAYLGHVRGKAKHPLLIARLASALGRATQTSEVEDWASVRNKKAWHTGTARAYLEAQGFVVLTAVGDAAAGDAMLAAGLPFLLYRLTRTEGRYREVPVLVRGFDRRTGLWLLEEPDGLRVDVVPRAAMAKARLLCAVPTARRDLLDPFRGQPAAARGREVEQALDELDRDRFQASVERLSRAGDTPVEQVYRAYVLVETATASRESDELRQARDTVERSRLSPPLLGFEAYVRGQALGVNGSPESALAAFDNVVRLEGPSATVEMARFAALDLAKDNDRALAAVTEALQLAPLETRIFFYRASIRGRVGDIEGARRDLRRALDREPDGVRVALTLARLEVAAGRPEEALRVLQEVERHDPRLKEDAIMRLERRAAELAMIEAAPNVEGLAWARRSPEPETRRRLAYELANRDEEGDAAEAMLRGLLSDPDPDVRISTLRLYLRPWLRKRIEADRQLPRRIGRLLAKDDEKAVRLAAAALLGRVDSIVAVRALAAAVAGEARLEDPELRLAAARGLGQHDETEARAALVAALEDESLAVRKAAIGSLFEAAATTHGYEPDDPVEARAEAVTRWKAWLAESG